MPIFNPHHDPAEASRMQSSTKRKVNQEMKGLADRGFFIERLSTAEYKASSGLKTLIRERQLLTSSVICV
jgi:hypothetical protein